MPSSVQARARNHKNPLLSPISGKRVNAAAPVTPDAICVAVRRWQRGLFDGWAPNAGLVQRCGAESGTEPERVGGLFIEEGKRTAPNA